MIGVLGHIRSARVTDIGGEEFDIATAGLVAEIGADGRHDIGRPWSAVTSACWMVAANSMSDGVPGIRT